MAAEKTNTASYSNISKRFELGVERVNANPNVKQPLFAKWAQDSYKRIQASLDKSDLRDQLRSVVGEGVGEMEEFLMSKKEVRDNQELQKGL